MKINNLIITFFLTTISICSCKKNYVCKGTDINGETTKNCNYCSKKQKDEYVKLMEDAGWLNVHCEKK